MSTENPFTQDPDRFIHSLRKEVQHGFGFIPITGSGLSAASGILMGLEFSNYLVYAMSRALGGTAKKDFWNFLTHGWPPHPSSKQTEQARKWLEASYKDICQWAGFSATIQSGELFSIEPSSDSSDTPSQFLRAIERPPVPMGLQMSQAMYDDNESIRRLHSAYFTGREQIASRISESPASYEHILNLGIRSLADWRTSLQFISRLRVNSASGMLAMSDPDTAIIDRFNTFITSGKQPNLGHKMLVHLQRPLRIRTILTTNFDTLQEQAFIDSEMPLQEFSVSTQGRLPDPFQVNRHLSIVKMHGTLHETRSDLSLESEPDPTDCERFIRYFCDVHYAGESNTRTVPNHALVVGFSGADLRVIRFLQHLLLATSRLGTKIFWICVSDSDVLRVNRAFGNEVGERVVLLKTPRPDLKLFELYQSLTLALPTGGTTFEYHHHVPPVRKDFKLDQARRLQLDDLTRSGGDPTFIEKAEELTQGSTHDAKTVARDGIAYRVGIEILDVLKGCQKQSIGELPWVVRSCDVSALTKELSPELQSSYQCGSEVGKLVEFDTPYGAIEACWIPFDDFQSKLGHFCIWLETADYSDVDSLARDLIRVIALRVGRFQRGHVNSFPFQGPKGEATLRNASLDDICKGLAEAVRNTAISPIRWFLFFYGREVAGGCSGWNGRAWSDLDFHAFSRLRQALALTGFNVIYAPITTRRFERDAAKWKQFTSQLKLPPHLLEELNPSASGPNAISKADPTVIDLNFDRNLNTEELTAFPAMVNRCLNFTDEKWEYGRAHFVMAATLFRQSRRPTALCYEAVQPCSHRFNVSGIDNDEVRHNKAAEWSAPFIESRVFYERTGGSFWMHRDFRIIANATLLYDQSSIHRMALLRKISRTHYFIGDWYWKAFLSTGHLVPAMEALYHRFQSAIWSAVAEPNQSLPAKDSYLHKVLYLRASMYEIAKMLVVARPYIKLWECSPLSGPSFDKSSFTPIRDIILRLKGRGSKQIRERLCELCNGLSLLLRDLGGAVRQEFVLENKKRFTAIFPEPLILKSPSETSDQAYSHTRGTSPHKAYKRALKGTSSDAVIGDSLVALSAHIAKDHSSDGSWLENYARLKGEAMTKMWGDEAAVLAAMKTFAEMAYAYIRNAKRSFHVAANSYLAGCDDPKTVVFGSCAEAISSIDHRKAWRASTVLCNLCIDWCKHLHPSYLSDELDVATKVQSLYALGLANLDRFYEAHRHLNEASGINSKRGVPMMQVEIAKLRIRRAEVLLTEAHRLRCCIFVLKRCKSAELDKIALKDLFHSVGLEPLEPIDASDEARVAVHPLVRERLLLSLRKRNGLAVKDCLESLSRSLIATLDDAWNRLEFAERGLAGRSQSSLWWGRLLNLKLRAFGYQIPENVAVLEFDGAGESAVWHVPRMLAYQHRNVHAEVIRETFQSALRACLHSEYRRSRVVSYYVKCLAVLYAFNDERDRVIGFLDEFAGMKGYSSVRSLASEKGESSVYKAFAEALRIARERTTGATN